MAWSVKNLQCGRPGFDPWSGRSPGEGNGNHTSVLAWEIPWTEEPHELQSRGGKESDMTEQLTVYRFWVASV